MPLHTTPCVRTYCPVSIVERAGMHTVFWLYARSYRTPRAASPSTTGVRAIVPPLQPSASYRCWSVVMKRILRPMNASVLVRLRTELVHALGARDQHRTLEARLAVLVRSLVLRCRHHLDEVLAARVLHERDRVPLLVGIADQDLVGAAHPQHLAAPGLHHLHGGLAVLVVLTRATPARAVGLLLELQEVQHHDGHLVGGLHELDELLLVRLDRAHHAAPSIRVEMVAVRIRRARATPQPRARRRRVPSAPPARPAVPAGACGAPPQGRPRRGRR